MSTRTATVAANDPKAGMGYDELVAALALYRDPKPSRMKFTVGMAQQVKKIELIWEAK